MDLDGKDNLWLEERPSPSICHSDSSILLPRPCNCHDDPLKWPLWIKVAILVQVSLLAGVCTLNSAILGPVIVSIADEFGVSAVKAGYQSTACVAATGIAGLLWVPLANIYGRRPVYLASMLMGFGAAVGSAYSTTLSGLLIGRVFMGLYAAAIMVGPVTLTDLFFMHQRGRAMGIFIVTLGTGSHAAPIIGGLIGQFLGWRWTLRFAAICNGVMFLVILFCLPETLHVCKPITDGAPAASASRLSFRVWPPYRPFSPSTFVLPVLRVAKYPSVLFTALYYGVQYGLASTLPTLTVSAIFKERYHFTVLQTGIAYGTALTIGAILGELAAGMVLDSIVKREYRKSGGQSIRPEARLKAIWTGEILVPAGLLIYGFSIANQNTHWSGAVIGMGIACFGVQVITTTCYTYAIDCYKPQVGEISQLFIFLRHELAMTLGFYAIPLGKAIGYQYEFLLFALVSSGVLFVPIVALMYRDRNGDPPRSSLSAYT